MAERIVAFCKSVLQDWSYFGYLATLLLLLEVALGQLIIAKVPYTEIDWRAYMQEVEGVLAGEYDYLKLRGDTGPLVYPAGFVYVFIALRYLTDDGKNIYRAQQLWFVFYMLTILVVFAIYRRSAAVPPWTTILLCLSRRVHSIFMLRLFNDGVAMLLAYIAIYLFMREKWRSGCAVFSLAVSIKMNVLLFAPGLLFLMLGALGPWRTIPNLLICAAIQVVLGVPFLLENWFNYLTKAFELSRVFFYKWTVNWKFIPEEIFISKPLALTLLVLHLGMLLLFVRRWAGFFRMRKSALGREAPILNVHPMQACLVLFTSNFVGICFARTLHYQFYCWYYHTLPFLLWQTSLPTLFKILVLLGIEYAFNIFPATAISSLVLQASHFTLLSALLFSQTTTSSLTNTGKAKSI